MPIKKVNAAQQLKAKTSAFRKVFAFLKNKNKPLDSTLLAGKAQSAKFLLPQKNTLAKIKKLKNKNTNTNDTALLAQQTDLLKEQMFKNLSFEQMLALKNKQDVLSLSTKKKEITSLASNKITKLKNPLSEKLSSLKKAPFDINFTIESQNRYQPSPSLNTNINSPLSISQPQGFVSALNFIGSLNAFGVPLNFNYSTNKNLAYNPLSPSNNLFKFDFDAKQFNGLLSNDIEQYYDLRKQVFEGADLSGYSSAQLGNKLKQLQAEGMENAGISPLQKYLGNADNLDQLLRLDDKELKEKLLQQVKASATDVTTQIKKERVQPYSLDSLQLTAPELSNIKYNDKLKTYLNDTANVAHLDTLNEGDISKRLSLLADSAANKTNNNNFIQRVSKAIVAKRESDKVKTASKVWASLQKQNIQADSALSTIKTIKTQLSKNGYDIEKILQMQKDLKGGSGDLGNSEMAKNYLFKKPTSKLQGLLSNLQAIKIGSFGNKVPGNMQNRDMFISGTHLSFNKANLGLSFGYGGLNDIAALKDASFDNSVFNTPKNITYISAEKQGGIFNNVKLSVVSSFNKQGNNSLYALPTISANNMAFTVSKALNLAYVGKLNIDVSKSTTLYKNEYNFGSDVFLNRQAGIQQNSTNDLFEALSFGVNHRLEIKKLNLSDNIYFNYSGLGYQNPANNGFSNARMRIGGNVRKSFYKNKLALTLRTDFKNMPISFTSNDKWQNTQLQFDTRYAFSKKFNLDIKYTSNTSNKQVNNQLTPVYGLKKIQIDGNANYKIGKHYSVSHFTVGTQNYTNTYATNATAIPLSVTSTNLLPPSSGSNMLMFNYIHSLLLRNNTLTATVFYNRELSPAKLIGNMLNTDIAYQYKLFTALNLSTAITYLDNENIVRQAGIRQTVQVFAGSHFDVDTFLDIRKNLITPLYADLYAPLRAEVMLRYHIKNKK